MSKIPSDYSLSIVLYTVGVIQNEHSTLPRKSAFEPPPFLNHKRSAFRVTSLCEEGGLVCFILSRMTSHLGDSTARAEERTATVFAAFALLFWNRIASTNVLTRLTEGVETPHGEHKGADSSSNRDEGWDSVHIIWPRCNLESS